MWATDRVLVRAQIDDLSPINAIEDQARLVCQRSAGVEADDSATIAAQPGAKRIHFVSDLFGRLGERGRWPRLAVTERNRSVSGILEGRDRDYIAVAADRYALAEQRQHGRLADRP